MTGKRDSVCLLHIRHLNFPASIRGAKRGLFEHNLCVGDYLGFVFADDIDGPLGVAGGPLVPKVRAIPQIIIVLWSMVKSWSAALASPSLMADLW